LPSLCCSGETEDTFIADLAVGLSTVCFHILGKGSHQCVSSFMVKQFNYLSYDTGPDQDRSTLQIRTSCEVQPGKNLTPLLVCIPLIILRLLCKTCCHQVVDNLVCNSAVFSFALLGSMVGF
jgi:hypothetical protein